MLINDDEFGTTAFDTNWEDPSPRPMDHPASDWTTMVRSSDSARVLSSKIGADDAFRALLGLLMGVIFVCSLLILAAYWSDHSDDENSVDPIEAAITTARRKKDRMAKRREYIESTLPVHTWPFSFSIRLSSNDNDDNGDSDTTSSSSTSNPKTGDAEESGTDSDTGRSKEAISAGYDDASSDGAEGSAVSSDSGDDDIESGGSISFGSSSPEDTASRSSLSDTEEDDINSLSSSVGNDNGSGCAPECAICLSSFEHGDKVCHSTNTCCPHFYHQACMEDWLLRKQGCPICRQTFLPDPERGV